MELIAEEGISDLAEAMRLKRDRHLQAQRHERTNTRQGYANGDRPKTVRSRIGALDLAVPKPSRSWLPSKIR